MADLKEAFVTKVREAENLKDEAAKQYIKRFDKAITQVEFLYSDLDGSSYGYFKEIQNKQLVGKPPPSINIA